MISIQQIAIETNNGQKFISALCFGDRWAAHRDFIKRSDLWYITHIPTGRYIHIVPDFDTALEIVKSIQDYDYPEHIAEINQVINSYNLELKS